MNGPGKRHRQSVNILQIIHVVIYGRKNMGHRPIGHTLIEVSDLSRDIIWQIASELVIDGSHDNF
jgi:hypothetical protein